MKERIWHKSYAPGMPKSIDIEEIPMPQFLTRAAKKFPNRTALLFMGKKITYAELDRMANRFADALKKLGIKKGDRIALLLPNMPQIVIATYGAWRIGAVLVLNSPIYTDRELEHQFNDSESTVLVTIDLLAPRMLALKPKTKIKQIITCHINDYLPFPAKQVFPIIKKDKYVKYVKALDYQQFLDLIKEGSPDFTGIDPDIDDTAIITYTGGTTGSSKGIILTHGNLTGTLQIVAAWFFDLIDKPEKELAIYPFFHMGGFISVMTLSIVMCWTDILILRPEPKTILNTIVKHKATIIPAVPTIYTGLLSLPEFKNQDLSFVNAFVSGSAPLPIETINALKEATRADLIEAYGMAEASFISTSPWRGKHKQGSVGVPLPNIDLKIVDIETGKKEVPIGQEGEIIFKGPNVCQGYYNNPEETRNSIRDGWLYTGDIGKMDEDGYLYIVDRKKDIIIAAGYNIYPREIDEVLYEHPKILEACVVGVSDEYRGETVKAFVVPKPGEKITEEELDAYCRKNLAAYKVPRIYEFVESLPKSFIGKILRKELKGK